MKSEYDFRTMKEKPHPLQAKIDSGELKLKCPFNISDEEFEEKLRHLDADERQLAIQVRQSKIKQAI
jgi:hypothetical protein